MLTEGIVTATGGAGSSGTNATLVGNPAKSTGGKGRRRMCYINRDIKYLKYELPK